MPGATDRLHHPPVLATPGHTTPVTALCGEQERALIKHPHVDPSRIVLVGRSFGGLIAPRGASAEHRLAAMIADPGQLEMGSAVMPHAACGSMAPATVKGPDPPKTSRPAARHHGAAHVLELAGALPEGEAMSTAVIGATGRVGNEIVRGLLARGDAVAALVRDPGKARRAFGEPGGLRIRPTRLDDPRDLTAALDGIRTVFIATGSTGAEGVLQRIAISAAAGISPVRQVTRLSVLNASAASLGINQRAHDSIDQFAVSAAVPYSTIRPAIFPASLLAAAGEVRAARTWTGLAGTGIPAGTAELLITREWAILAGENDYTTGTFAQITGRPPRPVAEFLHQYRAEFT